MKEVTIADVAVHYGVDFSRNENRAVCPVCGKEKLYINQNGCFYCHHDNIGGRGPVQLFYLFSEGEEPPKDLHGKAYLEVKDRMMRELGADSPSFRHAPAVKPKKEVPLRPAETSDSVYRDIVRFKRNIHRKSGGDGTGIIARHRKALDARGFVRPERYGIISVPSESECRKLYRLLKGKYGDELIGVPGFYEGGMALWGSGIMIPVVSGRRQYSGFQIRLDNPGKAGKYIYLSSAGKKKGCSCGSPAHIAGAVTEDTRDIIITEGCLKGDLINEFTGVTVCAFQGVNSLRDLPRILPTLSALGATVHIAYDMDATSNRNVLAAKEKLIGALEDEGIAYEEIVWPRELGKGYDDFLLTARKEGLI